MTRLFGTDGIRGIANDGLTPELAYKVARAGAQLLMKKNYERKLVLIGKDTRHSGDMIEAAMVAGFTSLGVDVELLGIIPTPGVAYLTRKRKALAGVVISASHNPGEYNGIKFFNGEGFKLLDGEEDEIEKLIDLDEGPRPKGHDLGRVLKSEDPSGEYMDYLKELIPLRLNGIKVAMDCGHGALYKIGPSIISDLGGEVVAINTEPDGMNINRDCGSTNEDMIKDLTIKTKAHIGLSFDGDGDRIIAVDNEGNVLNGDHILSICAKDLKDQGKLSANTVVGTIMTNMGLDEYLNNNGMGIVKTKVGDRYILEEMRKSGYVLGGEQSGHIIFLDYNTTGDGLATGLHLLQIISKTKKTSADLNSLMKDYPQVIYNARVDESRKNLYKDNKEIQALIKKVEEELRDKGRIVIRPSGTEPLVRVMIEAKDEDLINLRAKEIGELIEKELN